MNTIDYEAETLLADTNFTDYVEKSKKEDSRAWAATNPVVSGAYTISAYTKSLKTDAIALVHRLDTLCKDDNFSAETMLIAHAHTLDAMFNNLAQIAALNFKNPEIAKEFLNLAFRAQNQCGKTLQLISQISQNSPNELMGGLKTNDGVDYSAKTQTIEGDKTQPALEVIYGGKNA